jgi:hypothetical protein
MSFHKSEPIHGEAIIRCSRKLLGMLNIEGAEILVVNLANNIKSSITTLLVD